MPEPPAIYASRWQKIELKAPGGRLSSCYSCLCELRTCPEDTLVALLLIHLTHVQTLELDYGRQGSIISSCGILMGMAELDDGSNKALSRLEQVHISMKRRKTPRRNSPPPQPPRGMKVSHYWAGKIVESDLRSEDRTLYPEFYTKGLRSGFVHKGRACSGKFSLRCHLRTGESRNLRGVSGAYRFKNILTRPQGPPGMV